MIQAAKEKLTNFRNVRFLAGNIFDFAFDRKYDAVISSLAIHHLTADEQKINLFNRIYGALNDGGIFYNADVVLADSEILQDVYMEKWKQFMKKTLAEEEIDATFKKYHSEDHPSSVLSQIEWLKRAGLKNTDVIWKYYNFAVYGGIK